MSNKQSKVILYKEIAYINTFFQPLKEVPRPQEVKPQSVCGGNKQNDTNRIPIEAVLHKSCVSLNRPHRKYPLNNNNNTLTYNLPIPTNKCIYCTHVIGI